MKNLANVHGRNMVNNKSLKIGKELKRHLLGFWNEVCVVFYYLRRHRVWEEGEGKLQTMPKPKTYGQFVARNVENAPQLTLPWQ